MCVINIGLALFLCGILAVGIWALTFALIPSPPPKTGTATMSFSQQSTLSYHEEQRLQTLTDAAKLSPTVYKMKLMCAYLAENITSGRQDNIGQTQMIWLNPQCADIRNCDPDTTTYWFDFAQNITAVNAELNKQNRTINTGTFRYVRLEFCKEAAKLPNLQWQAGNMTAPATFTVSDCAMTSVAADPPIVLKEGGSIRIQLAYSLFEFITVMAGQTFTMGQCSSDGRYCASNTVQFTPSFVTL
jgi:hypothetical protein